MRGGAGHRRARRAASRDLPSFSPKDDHTRVKLRDVGYDVGADYINANYLNGEAENTEKRYIAAQGTMPETLAAFWQMIFENNCGSGGGRERENTR